MQQGIRSRRSPWSHGCRKSCRASVHGTSQSVRASVDVRAPFRTPPQRRLHQEQFATANCLGSLAALDQFATANCLLRPLETGLGPLMVQPTLARNRLPPFRGGRGNYTPAPPPYTLVVCESSAIAAHTPCPTCKLLENSLARVCDRPCHRGPAVFNGSATLAVDEWAMDTGECKSGSRGGQSARVRSHNW